MMKWSQLTSDVRLSKESSHAHNALENDYHRIIRSASFRRLQDKTQVFPLDSSDFVRTRLTHSLEVSSLARFIAKQVCDEIIAQEQYQHNLPDPLKVIEILHCASLLHDIGNPPFGHFGETTIREWFQKALKEKKWKGKPLSDYLTKGQYLDFLYYEGNAQAFRIIQSLHREKGQFGMHLTCAVIDTIIKYPCDSELKQRKETSLLTKKIGCFQSEKDIFWQIKQITGSNEQRNPMCFILEAADDLAYIFADLEDGFQKGLYHVDELHALLQQEGDKDGAKLLKDYLEEGKIHDKNPYEYAIKTWLYDKQLICVQDIVHTFMKYYDDIMDGCFQNELIEASLQAHILASLKQFACEKVYSHRSIVKLELMGNEIITFLLEHFVDALIPYDTSCPLSEYQQKYIRLLSDNYLAYYHEVTKDLEEDQKLYYRLLLAADYIVGMSDSYAKNLFQELRGYS